MIIFFCAVIATGVFILIKLKNIKNNKIIFKINKLNKINIKNILKELINKKINNKIKLFNFLNKNIFLNLNLIYAPVYLVNAKRLGEVHLNLFKQALEEIDKKINFVVLDGVIKIKNKNVNVVSLMCKDLSYEELALLNSLNINKKIEGEEKEQECELLNYSFNIKGLHIEAEINNGEYKLMLPQDCYGYFLNSKKIYNVFGELMAEIKTDAKIRLIDNFVYIKSNKLDCFEMRIKHDEKVLNAFRLFEFDLKYTNFQTQIDRLKQKAINELNQNPFVCSNFYTRMNVDNLSSFFKLAFLRKNYFNDYIFMLKELFGLRLQNDVLNVKPCACVKDDFEIEYYVMNEKFKVKYCINNTSKVSLYSVGHKLGVNKDYVFVI